MKAKCVIDMWHGEKYNKAAHVVPWCYWSDGRLCYWGWIFDKDGKEVGDFTAETMQDAQKALGVTFRETGKESAA